MSMMKDCGVCGVSFDEFQHGPIILCRQQHVYCEECTTQLFKQDKAKCPECRQILKKEDAVKFRQYLEWFNQMKNYRNILKQEKERISHLAQIADALKEIMGFQFPFEELFYDYAKQRAEKLFQAGKNHAAIALLMNLIERFPNQDRYQFIGLGSKEQQTGFSEGKSLSWYKQRQGVKYLSAEDLLNHFLMQTPSYEGGNSWYDSMTLKYPENYKLCYGSALIKHNKRDNQGAIQDYKKTLELNHNFIKAYQMLSFLGKDKEESSKYAKQYLIKKPSDIFAQFILATNLQRGGLSNFYDILRRQPEYARALNEIGNIYVSIKIYPKAIQKYKQCSTINRHYFEPVVNIGKTYFLSGDKAKAVQYFEKLIDTQLSTEQRSEILYQLGTIYKQMKDLNKSIAFFKEYLQLGPLKHLPKAGLAQSYALAMKYQFAIKAYNKITSFDNQNAQFFDGILKCYSKLWLHQQALKYFEKWKKVEPLNPGINSCIGRIYYEFNKWGRSINYYLECLQSEKCTFQIYMKIIQNFHNLRQFDSALKFQLSQKQKQLVTSTAKIVEKAKGNSTFSRILKRWEW